MILRKHKMTTSTFIRWSGLAAILAGLVMVTSSILDLYSGPAESWVSLVRTVLSAVAFAGVYLFQKDEAGFLGLLGFLAAFVGNLVMIVDFFIGGSLYSLGLIILAVGTLRARKFPRWVPTLWILAIVAGFPGFFVESVEAIAFKAGALILALAFIGAGYTMWSRTNA